MTGPTAPPAPEPSEYEQLGGYAIQDYVVTELNEERARRVRIDAQGTSLITGSTALSALAVAGTTLVTSRSGFEVPRMTLWALGGTFFAFMVAALCGLRGGGRVHQNQTVPIRTLRGWCEDDERWFGPRPVVTREHLAHILAYLTQIRRFNDRRARWIVGGAVSQILALLGLSVAVAVILVGEMFPEAEGWHQWLEPPEQSKSSSSVSG